MNLLDKPILAQDPDYKKKILLLDLENTPLVSYNWGLWEQNAIEVKEDWYILCFAYKWLGEKETYVVALPDLKGYKKDKRNDLKLIEKLWTLLDKADIIIGQNCMHIDTPVLMTDLTWKRAGDLKVGDELVGFDEAKKPGETFRDSEGSWKGAKQSVRWIKPTTITAFSVKKARCQKVTLSNGDEVITTPDHLWLARTRKDNFYKWIQTSKLEPGFRLTKFWNVWEVDKSYEAGWLSGFISGEGTLKQSGVAFGVDFCQRPGTTWEQALNFCDKLNIPVSKDRTHRAGGIGRQDVLYTGFIGGKFKIAENIGRLQIKRFIEKMKWESFGGLKSQNMNEVTVVSVKDVGYKDIAVISTSTKTLFGAGYPMHNCDAFDVKKANARFIFHGLEPPSPYKTIDTLKLARKYFKFDSNRLDNLGQYLKLGRKLPHTGKHLWLGCMDGDLKSWDLMKRYNKQDVVLLEKVYLKLRGWNQSSPNLNMIFGGIFNCPNCGSDQIIKKGYQYTRISAYQRWKCLNCGAWCRSGETERVERPLR